MPLETSNAVVQSCSSYVLCHTLTPFGLDAYSYALDADGSCRQRCAIPYSQCCYQLLKHCYRPNTTICLLSTIVCLAPVLCRCHGAFVYLCLRCLYDCSKTRSPAVLPTGAPTIFLATLRDYHFLAVGFAMILVRFRCCRTFFGYVILFNFFMISVLFLRLRDLSYLMSPSGSEYGTYPLSLIKDMKNDLCYSEIELGPTSWFWKSFSFLRWWLAYI